MSALIFIFVLGGLVIIHEWGHFIAARLCGVRVEKFSVGFGPVVFGRKKGDTEYCVSLLPLGGFVKLAGESPEDARGMEWEFHTKSLGQKAFIVMAGPLMNALLAFLLFSAVFMTGQPTLTTRIGQVLDGSPAMAAGLQAGDRILSINGQPLEHWDRMLQAIRESEGPMRLGIEREGRVLELTAEPKRQSMRNVFGKSEKAAFLGVAPAKEVIYVKRGVWASVQAGAERVWTLTAMVFYSLALMFTGAMSLKDSVTGPIGIYFMTEQAAQMGLSYLFYFMGSLSVSLFVLNILPVPVLDGGHLLFIVIEKLKGSPIRTIWKERLTQGGMIALLGLMAFVIVQDVSKFSILDHLFRLFGKGN